MLSIHANIHLHCRMGWLGIPGIVVLALSDRFATLSTISGGAPSFGRRSKQQKQHQQQRVAGICMLSKDVTLPPFEGCNDLDRLSKGAHGLIF